MPAILQIQALPPVQLEIELSWDQLRPDLDLHLLQQPGAPLGSTSDCGWTNPDPAWFSGGPDDNPRYQGDQLVGYGPEIIDWKTPQSGSYGIVVVYNNANGLSPPNTNARVRVLAFGVLVAELTASLDRAGEVWNAGVHRVAGRRGAVEPGRRGNHPVIAWEHNWYGSRRSRGTLPGAVSRTFHVEHRGGDRRP